MSAITAIGFDADDTLWQNETFFRMTEQRFTELLTEHGEHHIISAKLLEAERRNLRFYGYGVKGFTLSMIETAVEVTDGQAAATVIAEILSFGREVQDIADHQGRSVRPGTETRAIGPRRLFQRR